MGDYLSSFEEPSASVEGERGREEEEGEEEEGKEEEEEQEEKSQAIEVFIA